MKKIILLLTVCMAYLCADAQTIDKKLIYGKWMLYAMNGDGISLTRDSLEQGIANMISHQKAKHPDKVLTADDSLKMSANLKDKFKDLFKTYSIYDEKGNCSMFSGISRGENGKSTEQTGTYVWSGDDKIIQTISDYNPEAYIIVSLTAHKLVIRLDKGEGKMKNLEMCFVKYHAFILKQ
jgi:hypothetical protein